jgi:hypothetical protein
LALDLENIQGQQNNLADADQRTGRRVHDGLSSLLAEGLLELGAVVLAKVVASNGLTTILVYALEDLVSGGVAQTGEERDKLLANGSIGLVLEDDGVEFLEVVDLRVVFGVSGRFRGCFGRWGIRTLVSLLIRRFAMVSTCSQSAHCP